MTLIRQWPLAVGWIEPETSETHSGEERKWCVGSPDSDKF